MGLKFLLMVNKQGQTRLANYYEWMPIDERNAMEAEIIRKCLSRTENQCSFMEYRGMKVRRRKQRMWRRRGSQPRRGRGAARSGAVRRAACDARGACD